MLAIKRRPSKTGQRSTDWITRVYNYGVMEMAQKTKIPSTTLYQKLQGRSALFEDEVQKIDAELDRKENSAAVAK